MNSIVVVPMYDLSVLYNQHKMFAPLNYYIDFETLLQLSFNPVALVAESRQRIWEVIDVERSFNFDNPIKTMVVDFDSQDSYFEDEVLDTKLDIFFQRTYEYVNSILNIGNYLDSIVASRVKSSCLYLAIK